MKDTNESFKEDMDNYWTDLLNNTLKVNSAKEPTLNLSKTKFDPSRAASAGTV
jgi:hypothetical protein